MTDSSTFTLAPGFEPAHRDAIVDLYWDAFRDKLHRVMRPEARARAFIRRVADPAFAIRAEADDGTLLGVAGFKTAEGAFVGGELADLTAVYGTVGGLARGLIMDAIDRPLEPGILLMDGIFVAPDARGRGIGSALLSAIKDEARARGCQRVRLDVIDRNVRARALYERQGFVATETESIGPLRHLFGFTASTTMVCDV